MRYLVAAIAFASVAPAFAECGRPPVEAARPSPPHDAAALEEVLEKFDRNYASADRLRLKLLGWSRDRVFGVEKQTEVDVWLEGGSRGWLESRQRPAALRSSTTPGFVARRAEADGLRWSADRVLRYDPVRSTYEATPWSPEPVSLSEMGWLARLAAPYRPDRLLPVWGDASAEALRARFHLAVTEATAQRVCATARPRTPHEAYLYQRIDIIFDRASGRPLATRTVDPTGNAEHILSAREVELNGPRPPVMALKHPIRPLAIAR